MVKASPPPSISKQAAQRLLQMTELKLTHFERKSAFTNKKKVFLFKFYYIHGLKPLTIFAKKAPSQIIV